MVESAVQWLGACWAVARELQWVAVLALSLEVSGKRITGPDRGRCTPSPERVRSINQPLSIEPFTARTSIGPSPV